MRSLRAIAMSVATFTAVLVGITGTADAAPTWLLPQAISADGPSAIGLDVAVDGHGNAIAVWVSSTGGEYRVASARRPAGGTWSSPTFLSRSSTETGYAGVGLDAAGNAIAIWRRLDTAHNGRIQAAIRPAGGSWGSPVTLSAAGQYADRPDVAVNAAGAAFAVWLLNDGTHDRVQASVRPPGGTWSAPRTLSAAGQDASVPQVAGDAHGRAVAVWERTDAAGHLRTQAAAYSSAGWGAVRTLSAAGSDVDWPRVAVDGHGTAVAVWSRQTSNGSRIEAARRPAGGNWSAPVFLSAAGQDAYIPDVAADGAGIDYAVWRQYDGANFLIRTSVRSATGSWSSTPRTLSATGHTSDVPRIAVNAHGDAVAIWQRFDGQLIQSARRPSGGAWASSHDLSSDPAFDPDVAVDDQGNAVAVWERGSGVTAQAVGLDAAGPTAHIVKPGVASQTSTTFPVRWAATDRWSAVSNSDVRYRAAPYNSGFAAPVTWRDAESAFSGTFSASPGITYCFSVRARDVLNNLGSWSAQRCTATPLDDRSLAGGSDWTRRTGAADYLHTITVGSAQDATLTRTGVQARRIALLVTRCPGCGSVSVRLGQRSLGTFSLTAPTTQPRKLIPVATFGAVRSGTLRIRITSAGRPVRIDGVVLSRG